MATFFYTFQGIFAIFGQFVCSSGQSGTRSDGGGVIIAADSSAHPKGPIGWFIIISFTLVFLVTYPLHMYIAELYLEDDDFVFLIAKYCIGFLYVILIPILTLVVEKPIRQGVWAIILHQTPSSNDSTVGDNLDDLHINMVDN